ncbi:hypothetical protein TCAL_04163 [Tigriopus californicus]|uniref:Uncharacterized protein n=1 Tax=Tigriopus californicus TaxID=6832 RepID=A0A553NS25_TIGCA|nr:GA-binding protein subunit beta-2-like [Tigriopus californicus]TRY68233.1 hypothetical protein TCAL_04163 [Tigriopus californicus]|eukprot:TCALIF_04163-PA protein Name:"Similar to GABPB1 GA-binding protein subunit beta-1 (Homo sapiens)" AED:0.01 eAED:0.01 QI:168/1/1/1/1/1/4/36/550
MANSGILIGMDDTGSGPITVQTTAMGGLDPHGLNVGGLGGHLTPALGLGGVNSESQQCTLVELGKILLTAARDGDTQEVCGVIRKGAPFTTDWLGTSPLHMAAQNGHVECCEVLLRAGISKDARTKVDKTPMHLAAQEGHVEVLELLLKHSCDKEALDMLYMTPLHWAVDRGNVGAVEMLLRFGADTNAVSKFDKTPMEIASDQGRPDIFEMLQNADSFLQIPVDPHESDAATLAATQSIMDNDAMDHSASLLSPPGADLNGSEAPQVTKSPENDAVKFLEAHGITIQPEDSGGGALESHLRTSKQTLTLTEAGKMLLNTNQGHRPTTVKKVIVSSKAGTSKISTLPVTTKLVAVSSAKNVIPVSSGGMATIVVGSGPTKRILRVPPSQLAALKSRTSNIKIASPNKGTIAAASGSTGTKLTVLRVNPHLKTVQGSPAVMQKFSSPNSTITLAPASNLVSSKGITTIVTEASGFAHGAPIMVSSIKKEPAPTSPQPVQGDTLTLSRTELQKMLDAAKEEYREKMEAQEREMSRLRQQVEALAKGATFQSK